MSATKQTDHTAMIREFKNWRARSSYGLASKRDYQPRRSAGLRLAGAFGLGFLLCAVLALVPGQLLADSDTVEVAVNGQDDDEKLDAYRIAMRWSLQQRSQGSSLTNSESVRAAIRDAGNFVNEFAYQKANSDDGGLDGMPITGKVRETGEATHILTVTLASAALDALIAEELLSREAEDELTGSSTAVAVTAESSTTDRRTLVWLLVVDELRDIFVNEVVAEPVVSRMRELAGGYAWNLYFPELDTLDLSLLGPDDLIQQRSERIAAASQRYQLPQQLVGILTLQTNGQWQAQWSRLSTAVLDGLNSSADAAEGSEEQGLTPVGEKRFSEQGASLDEMLQRGVAWLVGEIDDQGKAMATDSSAAGSLAANRSASGFGLSDGSGLLWLGNIDSPSSYARTIKFLGKIEAIESVQPVSTSPGGMLFSVNPRSAISSISLAASNLAWLEQSAEAQAVASGASKADLYLSLQP